MLTPIAAPYDLSKDSKLPISALGPCVTQRRARGTLALVSSLMALVKPASGGGGSGLVVRGSADALKPVAVFLGFLGRLPS